MNDLVKILNQDGQLVVTSRQIAKDFEKDHPDVTKAIENLIGGIGKTSDTCIHLFIETQYQNDQNKQWYKEYLLTRDGFSLLVMGFTGAKALEWKLKYIEAFNKMEQHLKELHKPTCIEDVLIQSLQEMKDMRMQVQEAKQQTAAVKEEVQAIRDVVEIKPSDNWRSETNTLVKKICYKLSEYQKPKEEVYKALQERAACDLKRRLENMRARLLLNGGSKSKADNMNFLDVIADDKKLIEIYTAIVKEMAIKYKIA